jgi:hypothetical protein
MTNELKEKILACVNKIVDRKIDCFNTVDETNELLAIIDEGIDKENEEEIIEAKKEGYEEAKELALAVFRNIIKIK